MKNLLVISHACVIPSFRIRWRKLAESNDFNVHLLIPMKWEQTWFGEKVVYNSSSIQDKNFFIHALDTTSKNNWGKYKYLKLSSLIEEIKPDLIYLIHEESCLIHTQIRRLKYKFGNKFKVVFFTMNALGVPYKRSKNYIGKIIKYIQWLRIKKYTSGAVAHYPGCKKSLRDSSYTKPVLLQTQVGVCKVEYDYKQPSNNELPFLKNLKDKYVVGYCGRLDVKKGVDILFESFLSFSSDKPKSVLLLVGNGDLKQEFISYIKKYKITNIVITGFVEQKIIPKYLKIMDCFVLGSRTTENWVDTFPLVTVQAQMMKVPVIAAKSGAIPWQLKDTALYFDEGNIHQLKNRLEQLYDDQNLRSNLANFGYERSLENFEHDIMNRKLVEYFNTLI